MKTIFTLLLATFFSAAAFAFDEGKITITTAVQNSLQVYVDGRLYSPSDNTVVLNSVQPGNHTIKIYKADRNGRYGKNRDRKGDLVYASTVYVRPAYHVDVIVNRFGKALVDEKALADRNGRWDEEDDYDGNSYDDGYYSSRQAMSDYDFSQLVQRIRSQWFGKLGNAKDAIGSNYFTTAQIRQVVQLFTAESDKLELAKLSYKNTVDRQYFRQLYDLFNYQSQAELDRYVKTFKN